MISLEDDIVQSMERAGVFGALLNHLTRPTEAQLWLERAAAQLERDRDPEGTKRKRRDLAVIAIMERDGSDCWFCGKLLNGDVTLEHLQPLALGGKWDEGNLALAHTGCNKAAGHLPRFKKEVLREDMLSNREGAAIPAQPRDGGMPNKLPPSNS